MLSSTLRSRPERLNSTISVVETEPGDPSVEGRDSGRSSPVSLPQPPHAFPLNTDQDSSETQYVRLHSQRTRLMLCAALKRTRRHRSILAARTTVVSCVSSTIAARDEGPVLKACCSRAQRPDDGQRSFKIYPGVNTVCSVRIRVSRPRMLICAFSSFLKALDDDYKPFLAERWHGRSFTLPFDDRLARRRTFDRPWTVLPSKIADMPCQYMTPSQLLDILNSFF